MVYVFTFFKFLRKTISDTLFLEPGFFSFNFPVFVGSQAFTNNETSGQVYEMVYDQEISTNNNLLKTVISDRIIYSGPMCYSLPAVVVRLG